MSITLIGCGCGDLTEDARAAIDRAEKQRKTGLST